MQVSENVVADNRDMAHVQQAEVEEYEEDEFEEEILGDDMDYGFEDPMDQEEYYDEQYAPENGRASGQSDSFVNKSPMEYITKKDGSSFNNSIMQTTANTRFTPGSANRR